jgi:hypothetical protein
MGGNVANEAEPLNEEVYAVKATLRQVAIALEEVLTTYRAGTATMVFDSDHDGLRRVWGQLGPGLHCYYEVNPIDAGAELQLRSASELWDLLTPYRQPILDKLRALGWIEAANAMRVVADGVKRRRGRKRPDPKEQNQICGQWLKIQDQVNQDDFCNTKGISRSTLRDWLVNYPYSETS